MSTLILIGGATASGKSSLVKSLKEYYPNSYVYRRVQGFYDLARERNISNSEVFKKITPEEVDENFACICNEHELIFSDIHYAVQMNRGNVLNVYENYVPTVSKSLIEKLHHCNINVIPIFLDCSPITCFTRAKERFSKGLKEMRDISITDAEIESQAEKREFINLSKIYKGIIIDSKNNTIDEIVQIVDSIINENTYSKKLIKEMK